MGSQQLSVFQAKYLNLTEIPFFIFSLLSLFIVHVIIKSLIIKIIKLCLLRVPIFGFRFSGGNKWVKG